MSDADENANLLQFVLCCLPCLHVRFLFHGLPLPPLLLQMATLVRPEVTWRMCDQEVDNTRSLPRSGERSHPRLPPVYLLLNQPHTVSKR